MKSQSALQTISASPGSSRFLLLAMLLLSCTVLSTAALAASSFSDCDRLASDLRSLEVPADELPVDAGDHSADDKGLMAPDTKQSRIDGGTAPVLLLTPRVADIVREVFDTLPELAIDDGTDDSGASASADDVGSGATSPHAPAAKVPPVVQAPTLPRIAPPGARNTGGGGAHYVPRFQSPMYRTDI